MEAFRHQQAGWLEDYALFRALKAKFNGVHYLDWPADLVERQSDTIAAARTELADVVAEECFAQFLLFSQGARIRDYAHDRGIRLIGDLPFFVSPDSADVWTNPGYFLLDERRRPRFVAGVPPDLFSADGQLWGNPVYNWEALRGDGFRWCLARLRALLAYVDLIRLDHFRGFAAAWHIPAGSPNARSGQWVPGPGAAFFEAARRELGGFPFLAEDLGVITPDVVALRDQFQIPVPGFCNLPSTVTPTIRSFHKTTRPMRLFIQALMTTRRPGAGTRNCPLTSGAISGAFFSGAKVPQLT